MNNNLHIPVPRGPASPQQTTVQIPPNWFIYAKPNFENHLTRYRDQPGTRMLQIGAYTGDASLWLVNNILTAPDSHLTDVDTWEGSAGEGIHQQLNWQTIWNIYRTRLEGKNVHPFRMTSNEYFQFFRPREQFDIIYVDGDHTKDQVSIDAHNAHLALKPGGTLIFDDYEWYGHPDGQNPRDAIVPFHLAHKNDYEVIAINTQYWLRKNP